MSDFVIENGILKKYTGPGGDIVIPEGVTVIGEKAFWRCEGLTSVVIPEGVVSIESSAFLACTNLVSVTLPDSVTSLGNSVFSGCPGLADDEGFVIRRGVLWDFFGTQEYIAIPWEVTKIAAWSLPSGNRFDAISMGKEAFDGGKWQVMIGNAGVAVRDGETWSFYAYVSKMSGNNFSELVKPGKWQAYDLDLINNGPKFKYKNPARLLGTLGRILDPVELTDACRELHMEYLIKNAKKLIPIAEGLRCPAIVEAMREHGIITEQNKKSIAKLLAASGVPEIAAITL